MSREAFTYLVDNLRAYIKLVYPEEMTPQGKRILESILEKHEEMQTMSDRTEIYEDSSGEWRWRRKARNGEIIATSGEGYTRKDDAERAALRVFGEVHDAEQESETQS